MAEETILSFNATNWITVVIMVVISFLIFGTLAGVLKKKMGIGGQTNG